jgi:hypothetical protein
VVAALLLFLSGCKRDQSGPKSAQAMAAPSPSPTAKTETSAATWKTVEEFDYSWAAGKPPVHFKLELPEGYQDPGAFTRIHIQPLGRQEFVLDNQDGWIEFNSSEAKSQVYGRLQKQNLVRSVYLLFLPASQQQGDSPLLFLRSWGYASDPERLHVIGFQRGGQPILLFNDEFDLVDFSDLDGDGYPEIVGLPCFGQEFGAGLVAYTPFQVYRVPVGAKGPAVLSIPLSKSYNLEHYHGWAGPDCSEKLAVVLHPPGGGKPVIMDADKAQKLMKGTKP